MERENRGLLCRGLKEHHRQDVLAVISSRKVLTVEELSRSLPWIRWGELFFMVAACAEEGVVVLRRKGFEFLVQINQTSSSYECRQLGPPMF